MTRKWPHLKLIRRTASPPDRRRVCLPKRLSGQAGYTLIEMIMVIALMGLITVAINQAIAQTVRISSHGTDSMTAIKQVEDALRWFTLDVQQSQIIEPEPGDGFPLSLSWAESDSTQHAVTYTINGSELERSVSIAGSPLTDMVVARYINPDATATNCRLAVGGTFTLPDIGDAFTITGGQLASSGQLKVTSVSVSVTTTGTATYSSGNWSTPAAGDEVIVTAANSATNGTWSSTNASATASLTQDTDGDAVFRGNALMLTLTAYGGDKSTYSETREIMIFSRSLKIQGN
jgi:prepilin-type N-terminal cleavage/methylation domain-containing protein